MTFNDRLAARCAALVQRLTGYHGDGNDVTDPRQLYEILSRAESKRNQASINIPYLVSDATIQQRFNHAMNIRLKEQRSQKRPNTPPTHRHSSLELFEAEDLPILSQVRQSSSLENLTTLKRKELNDNKPSVTFENLPQIDEKSQLSWCDRVGGSQKDVNDRFDSGEIVLPKVPKVLQKTLPIARQVPPPSPATSDTGEAAEDTDWRLSGVPSEIRDRTKQILMEETFRERLRARGLGLNRNRSRLPRDTNRLTDLKAYDLYPGQYWELRADSVNRPEDLETDMIDRDYYRMKQKSILKLKGMDGEWKPRNERVSDDPSSPQTHRDLHRTTHRRSQPRTKPNHSEPHKLEEECFGLGPVTKAMLTASGESMGNHETDSVTGPPNSRKDNRRKLPYIFSDEPLVSHVHHYDKYTQGLSTPRPKYVPPTTVVNLTIDQETPKARCPRHIEENLQKRKQAGRNSESAPNGFDNLFDSSVQNQETNSTTGSESDEKSSAQPRPADDIRNKKLLTGFKKLEVFGETKPPPSRSAQAVKEVTSTKYRPQYHPPMYKLDMRNYPPRGNMIEAFFGLERPADPPKWRDNSHISLRVIDGGVILSEVKVKDSSETRTPRATRSEGAVERQSPVRETPVLSKS